MNLAATMSLSAGAFLGPLQAMRGMLGGLIGSLAAVGGATLSVAGAIHGLRAALDLGGRLSDLAARTGMAEGELLVLEQAFKNAGLSAEQVGPLLNVMQRSLAGVTETGESAQAVFSLLKLEISDLRRLSPGEQFATIAARIRGIADPAQQAAAAMKVFGRSGGEALALFKDAGALGAAAVMIGRQAEVLQRNAAQFDRASDILAAAPVKLQGFFVGAAESISASLLSSLEQVNQMDFTGLGQRVGEAIAPYIEAFKSGALGKIVGLSLLQGLAMFGAKLAQTMLVDLPNLIVAGIRTPFVWAGEWLRYGLAKTLLVDLPNFFIAGIKAPFVWAIDWLRYGLAKTLLVDLPKLFMTGIKEPIIWAVDLLRSGLTGAFASIAEKFRAAMAKVKEIGTGLLTVPAKPQSFADTFKSEYAKLDTGSDWPAWVQGKLGPMLEDMMRPFREAAVKSRAAAQELTPKVARAPVAGDQVSAPAMKIDSDRLARIGLFIGGGGGPALDFARRTADNTQRMAEHLKNLPAAIKAAVGSSAGSPALVWGG